MDTGNPAEKEKMYPYQEKCHEIDTRNSVGKEKMYLYLGVLQESRYK